MKNPIKNEHKQSPESPEMPENPAYNLPPLMILQHHSPYIDERSQLKLTIITTPDKPFGQIISATVNDVDLVGGGGILQPFDV